MATSFNQVNLLASDMAASLAFHRRLGLELPEGAEAGAGAGAGDGTVDHIEVPPGGSGDGSGGGATFEFEQCGSPGFGCGRSADAFTRW